MTGEPAEQGEDSVSIESFSENRTHIPKFFDRLSAKSFDRRRERPASREGKPFPTQVVDKNENAQPSWRGRRSSVSEHASPRRKSTNSGMPKIRKRISGALSNLRKRVGGGKRKSTPEQQKKTRLLPAAATAGGDVEAAEENSNNFDVRNSGLSTNMSPEEEEIFRPWRLEKAANIQKPKKLHKTGKEKKEDSFRVAPRPPPPPAELSKLPNYEYCAFNRLAKISAPRTEKPFKSPPNTEKIAYEGTINELEIKTTMKTWIWRRTGFKHYDIVRQMKVQSITDRHRYRYKLESFMERRSVRWIKIPYHGDEDEADLNIPVQGPWDIPVKPTNGTLWENETILMPVPGSTLLRLCQSCEGEGWIRCWKCDQAGNYLCYWCDGKGGFYDGEGHWKYCWTCKGIGIVYCTICKGYTKLVCAYCEGYFEVKFFIQLQVEFFIKVHKYYIEEEKTDVPVQKEKKWTGCRSGSGERVVAAEEDRLGPLSKFSVAEVNEISHGAISRHDNYYTGLRIHRQRHFVDVIPIFEIEAVWKETTFKFWIYGQKGQRKVFFPEADAFLPKRKGCCTL